MSLTEKNWGFEFVASEANGTRSREIITLLSGSVGKAGDVLGAITVGTASAAAVGTPQDTIGAVTVAQGAIAGVYTLTALATGTNVKFAVEDPLGVTIGEATVGTPFAGVIGFTITDVGTHAVVGDQYKITVAAGSGKYVPIDAAGTDGRQNAAAILGYATDATAGDKTCAAIVRSAEVNSNEIGFGALTGTLTSGQIGAACTQLKALGILVRTAI